MTTPPRGKDFILKVVLPVPMDATYDYLPPPGFLLRGSCRAFGWRFLSGAKKLTIARASRFLGAPD